MAGDAIEAAIHGAIDSAREEGELEAAVDDDAVVDDGGEDSGEEITPEVETKTTVDDATGDEGEVKPEEQEQQIDALMQELGIKPKANGKDNYIPYSRVRKITEAREAKAVEIFAKGFGLDPKTVKFNDLESAISEKLEGFNTRADEFDTAEQIMMQDPDRYIRILAHVEPEKYGKFAAILDAKPEEKVTAGESSDDDIFKNMPRPDLKMKMPDGSEGESYTLKGMQEVFKYAIQIGEQRAEERANKVLKPVIDDRKKAEDARKQQEFDTKLDKQIDEEFAEASQWEGFTEHRDEIIAAMRADTAQAKKSGKFKFKNIHAAYIAIVPKKLREAGTANEQEMRKKILAEMNKTTRSTAVTGDVSSGKPVESSGDPITDAIRGAIRKSGLKR
jgi:Fe-S-cluster formation regulator IscX/YfhJ